MKSDGRRIDLPQSPTREELAQTLGHLTGRAPDQREIDQIQRQLDVPQSSYAPGGETAFRTRVVYR